MLNVEYDNQAEHFLRNIHKELLERILEKIEKLQINPFPKGAITLQGNKGYYRIRIGDYRLIHTVDFDSKIISIVKIDKRERIY